MPSPTTPSRAQSQPRRTPSISPSITPSKRACTSWGGRSRRPSAAGASRGPGAKRTPTTDAARRGPAHAAPKKKRSGKRTAAWVGGTLLLVLVLIAGAAAGYGWYLNHEIHRIDLKNLTSAPVKGADAGTENILMIGSTDRCALKVQNPAYGLCSQGVNGVNSDVVMILHLNPANNTLSILSIPRDLFVPNARSDGANKIDAALYQGPDQLIKAIEEDFGIPIQHFVELNFDSFINVVERARRHQDVLPRAGVRRLLGAQHPDDRLHRAERHPGPAGRPGPPPPVQGAGRHHDRPQLLAPEAQSDLARIRRDHEFLRVLAAAVKAKGLEQPDHRPAARRRRGRTAHRRLGPLGHRHDQPGARVPRRQRELARRS